MKQLILVLAVHCLMCTANAGSTLPGKSLAETLIDSIPDSPRGSIKSYGVRLINMKKIEQTLIDLKIGSLHLIQYKSS